MEKGTFARGKRFLVSRRPLDNSENVMKRIWIGAAAASVIIASAAYAGDPEREPTQDQIRAGHALPKDQVPPPGAENMDRRAERAQTAAPMGEIQEPAQGRDKPN
jgi:hypothetical protein